MKSKRKMLLLILIMTVVGIVLKANDSKAALQSNGGGAATKNVNDWLRQIRTMQATGGTLGLTDSINGTNLTSGNKNLDIHMQKNTEYGAMVILSASSYGNPNKIENGQTTTGNQTGVVMKINKEWVAAGCNEFGNSVANFKNAVKRYKNIYTLAESSAKIGDASIETKGWGGSPSIWFKEYPQYSGLFRSYSASVFSYGAHKVGSSSYTVGEADYRNQYYSRAVVVVGSGI